MALAPKLASQPNVVVLENDADQQRQHESKRLFFLDVVRAFAALVVVLQHVSGGFLPGFDHWTTVWFNPGSTGVTAFFLVSGFIIPFSLERSKSIGRFWISRIFRLYPLYWFSLILAVVVRLALFSHYRADPFVQGLPTSALANLTMIQRVLKFPDGLGLYWTLEYELLFYVLCTALYKLSWHRRTDLAMDTFGVLVLVYTLWSFRSGHTGLGEESGRILLRLSVFFYGTLIYRMWSGDLSKLVFQRATAFYTLSLVPLVWLSLARSKAPVGNDAGVLALTLGMAAGFAVFFLLFQLRSQTFPPMLTRLGEISYSVYLLHGAFLLLGPAVGHVAGPLLTLTLVAIFAPWCYHHIEAPAIRLGRRVSDRLFPKSS